MPRLPRRIPNYEAALLDRDLGSRLIYRLSPYRAFSRASDLHLCITVLGWLFSSQDLVFIVVSTLSLSCAKDTRSSRHVGTSVPNILTIVMRELPDRYPSVPPLGVTVFSIPRR